MPLVTTSPVGYALPAIRGAGGYFAARNQYDTAWGNIILAIMTPVGARPFRRGQGSTMADSLFDAADARMLLTIKQSIVSAVAKQVPHVQILDVTTQSEGTTVTVLVEFALREEPSKSQQRAIRIDKRSVLNVLSARSR